MGIPVRVDGFVFSVQPRGERASLVSVLTRDGTCYLTLSGGMGGGKATPIKSCIGAECAFDAVRASDSSPLFSHGFSIVSPSPIRGGNLVVDCSFLLACELVEKVFKDGGERVFAGFSNLVAETEKGDIGVGLLNLAVEGIGALGIEPATRQCAECGAVRNLVSFDLELGGMICQACARGRLVFPGRDNLLSCRYLFETSLDQRETGRLKPLFKMEMFEALVRYLSDYFSVSILNFDLFRQVAMKQVFHL